LGTFKSLQQDFTTHGPQEPGFENDVVNTGVFLCHLFSLYLHPALFQLVHGFLPQVMHLDAPLSTVQLLLQGKGQMVPNRNHQERYWATGLLELQEVDQFARKYRENHCTDFMFPWIHGFPPT